jgi:hypothetical protein
MARERQKTNPVREKRPESAPPGESTSLGVLAKLGLSASPLLRPLARVQGRVAWILGAVLIVGLAGWIRVEQIRVHSPYPTHIDEPAILEPAGQMLKTGDLNPHNFEYPSLPRYIAAAALVAGSWKAAASREFGTIQQVSGFGYPYYANPTMVDFAKTLFGLMTALAILCVMLIVRALSQSRWDALVAGVLLLLSVKLLVISRYVNVDACGNLFALGTLAYLLVPKRRDDFFQLVLTPGVLAGLAIGSKYNYVVVLLPCIAHAIYHAASYRFRFIVLLLATSSFVFLLSSPYAILDLPRFVDDVASVFEHYARGHPGAEGTPGVAQALRYLRVAVDEYLLLSLPFALGGIAYSAWRHPRNFLLVALFVVPLLMALAFQKVIFWRNFLSGLCLYVGFTAVGLGSFTRYVVQRLLTR